MARRFLKTLSWPTDVSNNGKTSCDGLPLGLFLIVFVLTLVRFSGAQEKAIEAWWLNAKFTPSQSDYESLAAKEIDPKWAKLSVLSYEVLPKEAQTDFSWMHHGGFVFQVIDYFKRSGIADRELCGVFEDKDGHQGRFLLVLEKVGSGPWKVAFLYQQPGEAGFSVFIKKSTGLYWGPCMQCSEFSRLMMKDGKYHLVAMP